MPRYIPSIPIQDCYGSVGNRTYYHRHGKCFYKKKPSGAIPESSAQIEQMALHRRALEAWRSISPEQQKIWNAYAYGAPSKRPPYGSKAHISGYNLFVSAYHGFAQLGNEHVPEPKPYVPFPSFIVDWEGLEVLEGKDLQLHFFSSIGDGLVGHRYRMLLKLELTRPGHGRQPGLQRNFLATSCCTDEDGTISFLIEDYRKIWDLDLPGYTAHCRFILIDRMTGYRSNFRMTSFSFSF